MRKLETNDRKSLRLQKTRILERGKKAHWECLIKEFSPIGTDL